MKSAYELAMERMGGIRRYTDEEKKALSEIDSLYQAKRAEAELRAQDRLRKNTDPAQAETIRKDLAADLARIEEKREGEKERVRRQSESA